MLNLFNFKTQPYEHQKTCLNKAWDKPTYAFFMEMGTGKTKVAVDNIGLLRINKNITGVLILAPLLQILEEFANERLVFGLRQDLWILTQFLI